jgi:hypothetical protein
VTQGRGRSSGDGEMRSEALEVNDRVEEIYGQGEVSYRLDSGEVATASPAWVKTVGRRVVAAAGGQANRSGSGEVSKSWW